MSTLPFPYLLPNAAFGSVKQFASKCKILDQTKRREKVKSSIMTWNSMLEKGNWSIQKLISLDTTKSKMTFQITPTKVERKYSAK